MRARLDRIFRNWPPAMLPELGRETLLTRTEAFLNARSSFEASLQRGPVTTGEDETGWRLRMHREAFDLLLQANRLFTDLLGDAAFYGFYGPSEDAASPSLIRAELASRLRMFRNLLAKPGWAGHLAEVTREIDDMDGGDAPRVLRPEKRNPGQPKQPFRIARLRLRALCWNEHLEASGIAAAERQTAIASAYRATWDSIRKWRPPCEDAFGEQAVWEELRFARNSYWATYEDGDWRTHLVADGEHYYSVWRDQRGRTNG